MSLSAAQLKDILVEPGLVSQADFDSAVVEANRKGQRLDDVFVEKNLVPDDYLGQLVADAMGYPFVRVQNVTIPDHVLRIIPEKVARRRKAIALGMADDGRLRIALRDPDDLEFIRLIEKKMGVRVQPCFATARGLALFLTAAAGCL